MSSESVEENITSGKGTFSQWSESNCEYPEDTVENEIGEEFDTVIRKEIETDDDFEIDINDFFEYIGMNKETKFTEKTMLEFEEDLDFENSVPKSKIIFVPAKRFSNFNYHYLLETYIPSTVDLQGMNLMTLDGIEFMFFLCYVNAGSNLLTSEGLQYIEGLTDLIALIVERNKLNTLRIPKLEQLMYLNVSDNNIYKIDQSLNLPSLETLVIDNNRVDDISFLGHQQLPKLRYLSVTNNFIKDLGNSWSRHLETLYLGSNDISNLSGLRGLYKLRTLHLRSNQISSLLTLPKNLVCLEYLNIRANQIDDLSTLSNLTELPKLRTVILMGNPCTFQGESEDSYRIQTLSYLTKLKRLDKKKVTDQETEKAELLKRTFQAGGEEYGEDEEDI